ncbi:cytochrome b/b6 domain-containing protein (plasmid) [Ensifer adhaerens]|uniref:cytochrome b/b6 domain-containing protein n=1 Tax=Ensifer adhaerens TaxID=106592 RepID=UPI001CBF2A97|nr:cytochrome b/b6 domain-containing protein [Ensifer adhaerens]MBZ7927306.1 cytochrome b/b6 domain-containing protein [Ensifer adhaerens]UAX98319.1 cytochrome b/b6 domain-containing protein [Ensifer adhaerens]UAY05702.1 cytochrome b/b6 domain-containing protein [Ensifer adhaerens]UAY13080.1 cytochrome b/b6 domain-containing protein [Ensifer adhaerens]
MIMGTMDLDAASTGSPPTVNVWDPLVRVFHWSVVGLFSFSYLTGDEWKKAHILAGYVIIGLLVIRVIWGFIGTRHARFSNFIYSPVTTVRFLLDSIALKARRYIGHNPAGGAMVIALLISISGIAATGYMMTTDAYWGVAWVEETHELLANLTLGLIGLHVAGVVLASIEHKENLVRAMITGRKRAE